jgi:hypothetical protein
MPQLLNVQRTQPLISNSTTTRTHRNLSYGFIQTTHHVTAFPSHHLATQLAHLQHIKSTHLVTQPHHSLTHYITLKDVEWQFPVDYEHPQWDPSTQLICFLPLFSSHPSFTIFDSGFVFILVWLHVKNDERSNLQPLTRPARQGGRHLDGKIQEHGSQTCGWTGYFNWYRILEWAVPYTWTYGTVFLHLWVYATNLLGIGPVILNEHRVLESMLLSY